MNARKLYRSRTDRSIAGVCGGLGNYLGIDVSLLRLAFVLLFLLGGHGLLIYIIMWIIVPEEPLPAPQNNAPSQPVAGA
jgi:phage shock protein C